MVDYLIQEETLSGIADAIREKTGKNESIAVSDFAREIGEIPQGENYELIEKTIDLDFSNGGIEITPEIDEVFSKINILQPENLIPENIAEGIDIAGIIGTMAAGGGGRVAVGTVAYNISKRTVTHNLGVTPDLVILVPKTVINGSTAGTRYLSFFGISRKFYDKYPSCVPGSAVSYSSSKWYTRTYTVPMDEATDSSDNGIYNVSTTQFSTQAYGIEQVWIAIGGLT